MRGKKFWSWKREKPAIPKGDGGLRRRAGGGQRWVDGQADPSIDFPSSRGGNMPLNAWKSRQGGLIEDYSTWPIVHAVEVPKYSSKAPRSYVSVASSLALDMTKVLV